jgi:hypothetical protein
MDIVIDESEVDHLVKTSLLPRTETPSAVSTQCVDIFESNLGGERAINTRETATTSYVSYQCLQPDLNNNTTKKPKFRCRIILSKFFCNKICVFSLGCHMHPSNCPSLQSIFFHYSFENSFENRYVFVVPFLETMLGDWSRI